MADLNSTPTTSWANGVELACAMLEAIELESLDMTALEGDCRDGAPQRNVALPALQALLAAGDPEQLRAFAAVLTDFVATSLHCGTPDVGVLRDMALADTAGA